MLSEIPCLVFKVLVHVIFNMALRPYRLLF